MRLSDLLRYMCLRKCQICNCSKCCLPARGMCGWFRRVFDIVSQNSKHKQSRHLCACQISCARRRDKTWLEIQPVILRTKMLSIPENDMRKSVFYPMVFENLAIYHFQKHADLRKYSSQSNTNHSEISTNTHSK